MFESLSEKIDSALHRLSGRSKISDINIAEAVKDIRRALVDADVNYKLAKDFTDRIKERAMGQDVLKSLEPGQLMVKIVRDEIAELMGGTASELASGTGLQTVLMAGLQGSGKTTFTAKLGSMLKRKKGRMVLLAAADVHRPADRHNSSRLLVRLWAMVTVALPISVLRLKRMLMGIPTMLLRPITRAFLPAGLSPKC